MSSKNTELVPTTIVNPKDKTQNPLDAFRTYSYHFVLMALDTTDYLNPIYSSIVNNPKGNFYERPYEGPDPTLRRSVITDPGIGKRVIIIDTRVDTDFTIDNVGWGTTFVGNANSSNSTVAFDTYLSDGQMVVFEPRGMNFLNVLADISSIGKLNSDPTALPFLMKVIFVGHNDNGTTTPIYSVPPFGIFLTSITGSIDNNGTTYDIKYVGATNGATWEQTYDSVVDGINFKFVPGKDLKYHLDTFTSQINTKYQQDRNHMINLYGDSGINVSDACNIIWDIVATNKKGSGQFFSQLKDFGTNCPPHQKQGDGSVIYTGTKEGGVAEIIHKLFESSKTWQEIRLKSIDNASQTKGMKHTYKITTECKKTSPTTSNTMTFKYILDEYSFATVNIDNSKSGQGNAKPFTINPKDVYEFDYIYTGKNVDVLQFDMSLSMGYALWVSLMTTRALPPQSLDTTGRITHSPTVSIRPALSSNLNPKLQWRKGMPLPPTATKMNNPLKEYQNQAMVHSADQVWRNFMNYQAVQSELTIHGNPNLIEKFTFPNRNSPDYIKVNIKMPTTTQDIWEYNQESTAHPGGYYKDFWYQGYFNIITAKNRFEGGQFTQELSLIEIPQISSDMTSNPNIQIEENDTTQNPANIYRPSSTSSTLPTHTPSYSALKRSIGSAAQKQKQG